VFITKRFTECILRKEEGDNMKKVLLAGLVTGLFMLGLVNNVAAEIVSSDSTIFGPDSLTTDTETGLSWLDLTLTTQFSKLEMLDVLKKNHSYKGFRMATLAEVSTFLSNAGINPELGGWQDENFTPFLDLMELIGVTGDNGNYGGVLYDYSYGHVLDEHAPGWTKIVGLGVIDDEVADEVWKKGRLSTGGVPDDNPNDRHGSWLVMPTPETPETPEQAQATQDLAAEVVEIVVAEALAKTDGIMLLNSLEGALKHIIKGNIDDAIDQLNSFIKKVERLIGMDKIDKFQGNFLIGLANDIIDQLLNP
jgi:hypothetical protein